MATDPFIGQLIGNYRIVDLIGRGGMGSVYLAENQGIKRQVAIKLLLPHLSFQRDYLKRFHTEANAIARINHPGVVEIYDFGRTPDGSLYYVMELLRGRGLDQLLSEKQRLAPAEVLPLLVQICSALDAAHQAGVVHRDLKLDNIFIMDRSPLQVKLLDFGVAKLIDPGLQSHMQTSAGLLIGTPTFMAPEQAAGRSEQVGPPTDFYALGVVLFFLLTGKAPFDATTAPELMVKHMHEPPPRLRSVDPSLPEAIEGVINRCLAKQPRDRPPAASWVAASFAAALRGDHSVPERTMVLPGAQVPGSPLPLRVQTGPVLAEGAAASSAVRSRAAAREKKTRLEPAVVVELAPGSSSGEFEAPAPGGTHAKIAALASRSVVTNEHHRSTLSSASGEMRQPARRAIRLLTALVLGSAVGAAVGLLLFLGTGDQPAEQAAPPASAVTRPLAQPLPDQAVLRPRLLRQVQVLGHDPKTSCRYTVARENLQSTTVPCRIEVEQGEELWLELTRDGERIWSERWLVNDDRELSAEDMVRQHLIAHTERTSQAGEQALIHSPPKRSDTVQRPRPKSRQKKARPARKLPRKLPPERVGSGTMDF